MESTSPNDVLVPVYENEELIFIPVTEYYLRHRGWAILGLIRNERADNANL